MNTAVMLPPVIATIPFFEMVLLPGQKYFSMGGMEKNELPVHEVNIASFYMGKYQVTQQLWKTMMGNNPSYCIGKRRPVERISWYEIHDEGGFLDKLNRHEAVVNWLKEQKLQNQQFRLPSEAEWEYASCGGEQYEYAGSANLDRVAWYSKNSHEETKPVGLRSPNAFGLYDMCGNVWEWCEDDWHDNYKTEMFNGSAWVDIPRSIRRVLRGGSYIDNAGNCRAAARNRFTMDDRADFIGFRLALSPPA